MTHELDAALTAHGFTVAAGFDVIDVCTVRLAFAAPSIVGIFGVENHLSFP